MSFPEMPQKMHKLFLVAGLATAVLPPIRRQEAELRGGEGQLSPQNDAMLQARIDRLSDRLRQSIGDGRGS